MSNFDLFTHQSTGELDFLAIDLVIAMKTAAYHLATSFLSQYITVSMILTSIDLVFGIHFDLTLAFGRLVLPSLMALPRTTAANHWFTAAQLTVSILLLAVPLRQLGFGAGILIVGETLFQNNCCARRARLTYLQVRPPRLLCLLVWERRTVDAKS